MNKRVWRIYLSGEIHSDWREIIAAGIDKFALPCEIISPITDHQASDDCGDVILGAETDPFWKDHKAAKINALRTRVLLEQADLVVVKFGDKYRQWNAAFDAGQAAALGKPYVTIHDESLTHALKEVNAAAYASCRSAEQVVDIFKYITSADANNPQLNLNK